MVLEIKNLHECDCDRCNAEGEIDYHAFKCEICNTEYEDGEEYAIECEEKHKKSEDLQCGFYLYEQSRKILDKHAKLPGQKTLC